MDDVQKNFVVTIKTDAVDIKQRTVRVLASDGSLDRDGERILPSAFRLDNYLKNPVIVAAHTYRLADGTPPVVGAAKKLWIDEKGLWCVIEFATTPLAEQYWELYSKGFMRAVSVGFIPRKSHPETIDGKLVRVHTEVELFEISCCAIPANPNAVTRSKAKHAAWLNLKKQEKQQLSDEELMRLVDPDYSPEKMEKQAEEFAKALLSEDDSEFCGSYKAKNKKQPDFSRHFVGV